jgi:membrane protein DedA with SNARE-associated domain
MSRFITPARVQRAEIAFDRHGGKVLFAARFFPGVRAVFFFTAGVCAVPFWRLLAFDGSAALIHVPALMLLGWYFSGHIDAVRRWEHGAQLLLIAGAALCATAAVLVRRRKR